ncbi:MAG: alpha/beta fold hydrolase [Methanobacteriota archaeon]|nr:MAG: alpha/beta fold hydrolase [Euryarchaeota archaeon]
MTEKRYAEAEGVRLAYISKGRGEPLLLVHGITTYSFLWRRMIPGLAKRFKVIAPDLLGCGDSDKPPDRSYSISAQADLLARFLDALGIEKVHFTGHDIGGGIGQIFAVRYPERTTSLVLINTIGYDYWPVQPITSMRIPILRELGMAALDRGFLRLLVRRGLYHKDRVTEELMDLFRAPLRTREGRRGFLRLAKSLDNRHLMDIAGDLKRMKTSTLIIRGDADPYLSPEISERLHRDIPGSKLIVIPTGGHFIQEDEPELLTEHIIDFIREETGKEEVYERERGDLPAEA